MEVREKCLSLQPANEMRGTAGKWIGEDLKFFLKNTRKNLPVKKKFLPLRSQTERRSKPLLEERGKKRSSLKIIERQAA